jgi:ligand-binding sensor domain-containing protein
MPWLGGTLADSQGNLWMTTFYTSSGGLHKFDGDKWETFTPEDGLAGYQVSGLVEDNDGNIWAITDRGVNCYDGVEWRTFTSEDGLASNNVLCILEDSRDNLWFGTYGGVSYYRE